MRRTVRASAQCTAVGVGLLLSGGAAAQEGPYAPLPVWVAPSAPEPHPSPTLFLALGGVLTGLGVVNLATAPGCVSSLVLPGDRGLCVGLSVGFGVGLVAAGMPLLVLGVKRREAWLRWAPSVTPAQTGAVVGWTGTF